jgi:hypothetical protein
MASSPLTSRSGGATPVYPASPARSRSNSAGQVLEPHQPHLHPNKRTSFHEPKLATSHLSRVSLPLKIAPALIAAFAASSPRVASSAASPTATAAAPFHGLRTTKKVYEGQEEYRKHAYLQGGGATSEQWQQVRLAVSRFVACFGAESSS